MKKPRIVHLTTVHPRDDIRIFRKECVSLAQAGYELIQVVGDGLGDAQRDGVQILDLGPRPASRRARMRSQPQLALAKLRTLQPALLHIHDPELLPLAVRAARELRIPVVYDAHEDVPRQILTKQWIPAPLRRPLAWAFERYENAQVSKLSAVVAATPHIAERFAGVAPRSVNVSNFPFLHELAPPALDAAPREAAVCYVGGLMRTRGLLQLVRALPLVGQPVTLLLAGRFEDAAFEAELRAEPGWAQVAYQGQVGREQVRELMGRCVAGIVTLLPMPSYLDSLPIKLFEYQSAALPVIASNFPLWRGIVERHGCGVCVDPADPAAIAAAIRAYLNDPERVQREGAKGRAAVLAEYQWPRAEAQLLKLYQELLG